MKITRYIIGAGVLICMLLSATGTSAQKLSLKVFEYNIKSFEGNNTPIENFEVTEVIKVIKAENPDIVCFNEFETTTGRMFSIEKLTECAKELGMYPYYVKSYPKEVGYYGNGILSKYPIVNSSTILFSYKNVKGNGYYDHNSGSELGQYGYDQRSFGYIDIMVPTTQNPEGVVVRVVCTHFDHFAENVELKQAKELIAKLDLANSTIPTLLLGDLNCGPGSSPISELKKFGTRLCNDNGTFGGWTKLDYIIGFPKDAWSCNDYKVIANDAISDHRPIVGTAVLK